MVREAEVIGIPSCSATSSASKRAQWRRIEPPEPAFDRVLAEAEMNELPPRQNPVLGLGERSNLGVETTSPS